MAKYDLQDRLIDFSVNLIKALDHLPNTIIGKHLKGQLTRSCTSPALNYAEACDAESRNCLLYTSPSPRDRTRSRMPSSA